MFPSFAASLACFSRALLVRKDRCAALLMPRKKAAGPKCAALPPGLNAADFAATWTVYSLKVPSKLCNNVRHALKPHVLQAPRVPSVARPPPGLAGPPVVLVLLKYLVESIEPVPAGTPIGNADSSLVGSPPAVVAALLRDADLPAKTSDAARAFLACVAGPDVSLGLVQITHANWSADAILRRLLPPDVTVPASFETVGHIVHLNLRAEHLPHKAVIGAVLLAKLRPRVRTVVNKLTSLGGPFRTFQMEVLAGDADTETSVRENGCRFALDFAKVYWNSRLETEHRRIVESLSPDDVLADAFAGVGPFAVPAARQRRCRKVFANDLNPASVDYLRRNARANGVAADMLVASCGCARAFLRRLVREERVPVTKVVMNFPSGAPEFLDMFVGMYYGMEDAGLPMPTVHCYGFIKDVDGADEARRRVRDAMFGVAEGGEVRGRDILADEDIVVRNVRDVAPRKHQVCITFKVPPQIAYAAPVAERKEVEISQARKRQKTEAVG